MQASVTLAKQNTNLASQKNIIYKIFMYLEILLFSSDKWVQHSAQGRCVSDSHHILCTLVLHLLWPLNKKQNVSLPHRQTNPSMRYRSTEIHQNTIKHFASPGAQLSTRAPRARPVCQSLLKLVMGSSGSLFWIHPSSLCLGVFCLPSSASSSSSHMGMEME